ncbi:hypothetical protein NL676_038545 [Syzygium grande]|nr:hypothetical protein NL676_038545 [Syzygium grande]
MAHPKAPHKPLALHFCRPFSIATAASAASGPSVDLSCLQNVAVIIHVDHGKTTLMDWLLRQFGADIPHERGITIASRVSLAR